MKTSERVVGLLNNNGLRTSIVEGLDGAHIFSTSMVDSDDTAVDLMYLENEDDDIISFCTPSVYEYDDDDFAVVINAINEISINTPFIKPVIIGSNSIWLYYDHKLFGQKATLNILHHIILTIITCSVNLLNKIDELKQASYSSL